MSNRDAAVAAFSKINKARTPEVVISEWQDAVGVLARAKDRESELRREILEGGFGFKGEDDDRKGTDNLELNNGDKLKAVFKQNYKFPDVSALETVLKQMERSAEGALLAPRLVKWKPELSMTEYNQLPEKFRDMIDTVLTHSAGTPSLEYVVAKQNRK